MDTGYPAIIPEPPTENKQADFKRKSSGDEKSSEPDSIKDGKTINAIPPSL